MITFIGEYNCRIDTKGRVILPSAFKKQMTGTNAERFVIKKDIFENCLLLYPYDEWERQNRILRKKINPFKKEHNQFLRQFFKGMAELFIDANSRLLIPKRLLDEVSIDKEIIMAGQYGKIEIWARDLYDKVGMSNDTFAGMAENIMEGLIDETDE